MKICLPTSHPRWRLPETSITQTIAWPPRQKWHLMPRSLRSSSRPTRLKTSLCANYSVRTPRPEKIQSERWGQRNVKWPSKLRMFLQMDLTIKPALQIIDPHSNFVRSLFMVATKLGTQKSHQDHLRDIINLLASRWWRRANPLLKPSNHLEDQARETTHLKWNKEWQLNRHKSWGSLRHRHP